MASKKETRGGSRAGSGRKKKPESEKTRPFVVDCYIPEHKRYRKLAKKLKLNHRMLMERMLDREDKV